MRAAAWFLAGLGATVYPVAGGVGLVVALIGRPRRPLVPLAMPLALVGTMALLSGVLPPSTPGTTWPTAGYVALAGVLAWSYVRIELRGATTFAWGLLLGALVNAAVGAWQAIAGSGSITGLAFHHNIYAAYLVLGLGAAGWLGSRASSARVRVALVLAALALVAGLIPSGSRSGLVGLVLFAVVLVPFVAARWRPRVVLLGSLSIAVLVLGLVVADAALSGASSRNLLVNGSFEHGTYPWRLGPVASRVVLDASERDAPSAVIRHDSDRAGWDVPLSYGPRLPVAEGTSYVLSFDVRPVAGAEVTRSFVRVAAVDAGSTVVGRVARDGWADGDEGRAGGRIMLPTEPVDAWQRVTVPLETFPAGTRSLRVMFPAGGEPGRYGFIDGVQLERGDTATAYVPGRRPGLKPLLGALPTRLQEVWFDPIAASGGRVEMWRFGLRFAAQRPVLGYGPGAQDWLIRFQAARWVADPLAHLHSFYVRLLVEGGAALLSAVLVTYGVAIVLLARAAWRRSMGPAFVLAATVALLGMSGLDNVLTRTEVLLAGWILIAVGTLPRPRPSASTGADVGGARTQQRPLA